MARLKDYYRQQVVKQLMATFGVTTIMLVPKLTKITLNMGVGQGSRDKKVINNAVDDMTKIAGQKPIITKAHQSIAGFKIRSGMPIGCKVTLRNDRMYEFLDRLISIVIPRIRDFRGMSINGFDGRGNYNMGIKEQIVFPEIDYDKLDKLRGLDIAIVTNTNSDDRAKALLKAFNFPFKEA